MLKSPSELAQIDKEAGQWKLHCQVINILINHNRQTLRSSSQEVGLNTCGGKTRSLRGRRSKGKGKGIRARDAPIKTPFFKTPFPFPFKRLPRRLENTVRVSVKQHKAKPLFQSEAKCKPLIWKIFLALNLVLKERVLTRRKWSIGLFMRLLG